MVFPGDSDGVLFGSVWQFSISHYMSEAFKVILRQSTES